jgi:hypothetical protein
LLFFSTPPFPVPVALYVTAAHTGQQFPEWSKTPL